jgi:hypothetical protein
MVYFQTKNLTLGRFLRVLQCNRLVCFVAIWSILRTIGISYGHLVYLLVDWYIFPVLVSITEKNLATLVEWPMYIVVGVLSPCEVCSLWVMRSSPARVKNGGFLEKNVM